MVVIVNNFSAFKLFYDELIYKKNSYVSYAKIDMQIEDIKVLVSSVRKFSKIDQKLYMNNLKKCNKAIKEDLEVILKNNKPLMEYYYLMYKSRLEICNDKLDELPFILSNSFYNDYRIDDKSIMDLELSSNTIPKYSSIEKKCIREMASKYTRLEYFVSLLKSSSNVKKYNTFLEKINLVFTLKPLYNETHFIYFKRVESLCEGLDSYYKKLETKAKESDDYEEITLKMRIAYRKKMDDWQVGIKEMVAEYFDYLFNTKENDLEIKSHFNVANELSYSSYLEVLKEIKDEKDHLEKLADRGVVEPVKYYGDSYLLRFREVIINSYFDKKYYAKLIPGDVDSYVDYAINLYSLARDLEDSVLDYYLYLASHSRRLQRNNDVKSAIITSLYELYSPYKSLDRFEAIREYFATQLAKEKNDFKNKYNTELLNRRIEYGFKGMIPNINAIKTRLNERCKVFVIENCLENITNMDQTGLYDTRNYDLEVLCSRLNIDELMDLYMRLKAVFANFPDSHQIPQRFMAEVLYNRLDYHDDDDEAKMERLKTICSSYLKEEALFI